VAATGLQQLSTVPCCHLLRLDAFGHRVSSPAANWIEQNLSSGAVQKEKFLGGSNWSSAYVYTTADGSEYFVKLAMSTPDDAMFRGEALGLTAMYGAQQHPATHGSSSSSTRQQEQQQQQQQQQHKEAGAAAAAAAAAAEAAQGSSSSSSSGPVP
jgi:hypothetical protein